MCRSGNLVEFLDLGFTPPADRFLSKAQLRDPETYYPLTVALCEACGLVQLSYVVAPDILYKQDYPYESSTTQTGKRHWTEFADTACRQLALGADDLVVDVGSNVGVLLDAFRSNGTKIQGVDPATNIALIAERRGVPTLNEFFSPDVARQIANDRGHASLITGTNVFAHADDLDSFVQAVDLLLNERGVFIFEAPYLLNLVKDLEYDTIYHEHLSYLSVKPLVPFFGRFGMEIFDIQQRDIHGGSFRVFVSRAGQRGVTSAVETLLRQEEAAGLSRRDRMKEFGTEVERNRQELLWLLRSLRHEGHRIAGVSAPAKGMTLLNYCHIGTETLDFVTEKSKLKIGRYTPGTHIPVVGDDMLLNRPPQFALLLAWNFADEIMNNLSEFRRQGGRFIIPIPRPRVIE